MDIVKFVSQFRSHPILFIGTGISLRYLEQSYTWESLLTKISVDIFGSDETYFDIKSKYYDQTNDYLQYIASDFEELFSSELSRNSDIIEEINHLFYTYSRRGINVSRLKLYISKLLSNPILKNIEEINALKATKKNIGSIITTNYDTLLEQIFDFEPLIGNDILLSQPYGSIYKIHGCVNHPEKIIITNRDYEKFENNYKLIRAQLVSLFIHHPIIFLGYSIRDKNIKDILKTIFEYVDVNSELSKQVRRNFLLVEHCKGSDSNEIIDHDIDIENIGVVTINKIKTDNFIQIYRALENLTLKISVMDIRKVSQHVKNICTGGDIKVKIVGDIDKLNNSEMILAIGDAKLIQFNHYCPKDPIAIVDEYFHIIEDKNVELVKVINQLNIDMNRLFPIHGFMSLYSDIKNKEKLIENQNKKIGNFLKSFEKNFKIERLDNVHSIDDILNSTAICKTSKLGAIGFAMYNKIITLEDSERFLKEYTFSQNEKTYYRKLVVIYDLLKYGSKKDLTIVDTIYKES